MYSTAAASACIVRTGPHHRQKEGGGMRTKNVEEATSLEVGVEKQSDASAHSCHIGFIGAGKVGTSLAKHFMNHNLSVMGFYSRTLSSAKESAEFTHTNYFKELKTIIAESDVLFLTVPDGAIQTMWGHMVEIARASSMGDEDQPLDSTSNLLTGKLICHCSGALTSQIFSGIEDTGAFGFSIHPLLAVSSRYDSYQEFSNALFTIESLYLPAQSEDAEQEMDKPAHVQESLHPGTTMHKAKHAAYMRTGAAHLQDLQSLLESTGLTVQMLMPKQKLLYHSAAVMASNLMVGLIHDAEMILKSVGFSSGNAHLALSPLLSLNAENIAKKGCIGALTGPIERNDVETVQSELEELKALDADTAEIYRLLSKQVVEVAEEKHLDTNYGRMELLLEKDSSRVITLAEGRLR